MQAQTAPARNDLRIQRWGLVSRVAFRFCLVYFGLYCLTTQILGGLFPNPRYDIPDPGTLWPVRQIVSWTAAHVFRVAGQLVVEGSGSGDKTFDWVLVFCLLVVAAPATVIWSVVDRRRESYAALYRWFHLSIRFALASEMFLYGMVKVVPLQMPFPFLNRLVEPYGNFSPMGVLWASVGSSPGYEIFAGSAEMLAGILLVIPRTATLGALICLADTVQIFALNMTYDVPVKLFAFHLILMALFLLVPELPRLADFFFRNRIAATSAQPELFRTPRANRIAAVAQILFGIGLVCMNGWAARKSWYEYGGGRAKSALYGIWNVEQMSIDGKLRSPLLTDYGRWRRAIFDFPDFADFQRMDDSFAAFGASIDVHAKTLTLTKRRDAKWKAHFTFLRAGQNRVTLDGDMDGHPVLMQLALMDRNKFLLVSRGFHWIQEYPFNR